LGRRFLWPVWAGLAIAVALLLTVCVGMLRFQQRAARTEAHATLHAALDTSHWTLRMSADRHRAAAGGWAQSDVIRDAAEELLATERTAEALLASPSQQTLREWYPEAHLWNGLLGFFLVAPDNTNLASSRDVSVGSTNLLAGRGDFLERLRAGNTAVSVPLVSDVPVADERGVLQEGLPTAFAGAPVRDRTGEVIALLLFRVDLTADYMVSLQKIRIGDTGEAYAIDGQGLLASPSRFEHEMVGMGLLNSGQTAVLNVVIRELGVPGIEEGPLTRAASALAAGHNGADLEGYPGYRGEPVVGAWRWDDELSLGIIVEQEWDEVYRGIGIAQLGTKAYTGFMIALLVALVLVFCWSHRQNRIGTDRLRQIIDMVPSWISLVGADGRFVLANRALADASGTTVERMLGSNRGDFDLPRVEMRAGNDPESRIWTGPDGHKRHLRVVALPLEMKTVGPSAELQVVDDVTTYVELEEELRRARDDAEAASRAKSAFLANMTHEIRTPLHAILGNAQLLSTVQSSMERKWVDAIDRSGNQLMDMLGDVMEVARLHAGQVAFEPSPTEPYRLLQTVAEPFRKRAHDKGLMFEVSSTDQVPAEALLDATKLESVVARLLDNAIKFTTDGGIVLRADARIEGDVCWLDLAVEDTGIGIDHDDRDRVLDTFEQVTPGSEAAGGSGLGLAICREYVTLMGGELSIESREEQGTTVRWTLPAGALVVAAAGGESGEGPDTATPSGIYRQHALREAPPADLIRRLREATAGGYLEQLAQRLVELEQYDPGLAMDLLDAADRFDYESLNEALDELDGKGGDDDR